MDFVIHLLLSALSVYVTAWMLPGVNVENYWNAILVAFIIGVLNAVVKPFLVVLTIPITVFTLGLFLFVIDAVIILIASKFLEGFQVNGFWWALLFSLISSVISQALYRIF